MLRKSARKLHFKLQHKKLATSKTLQIRFKQFVWAFESQFRFCAWSEFSARFLPNAFATFAQLLPHMKKLRKKPIHLGFKEEVVNRCSQEIRREKHFSLFINKDINMFRKKPFTRSWHSQHSRTHKQWEAGSKNWIF